ncbi:hypothetical protein [Streptomyces sp. NPDC001604]|uniref:hypothetical protein n=1 Tax=Streptomyces sp. NPDC001604 TaxID=3364593 RepID=UPI0036B1E993
MNRVEYAAGDDPLYGPNPLTLRGMFPPHWGEAPDSPAALPDWIQANAVRDGAAKGHPSAVQVVLEKRREDPSAVRERAAVAEAHRQRRDHLQQLRLNCP